MSITSLKSFRVSFEVRLTGHADVKAVDQDRAIATAEARWIDCPDSERQRQFHLEPADTAFDFCEVQEVSS